MIKKLLLLVVNIMNTKNLTKFNKKRQFENEIINKLCIDVIKQLETQYVNQLKTKGRVLTKFLIKLSENINHTIICLNNDNEFKSKVKNDFRLNLIAESQILKSIIDDIYDYSIKNHDSKFIDCINIYKTTLSEMFESPKKKIKNMHIDDEEDDEDDEDDEVNDEDYNYHYGDSSDSDEEEPIVKYSQKKNNKRG